MDPNAAGSELRETAGAGSTLLTTASMIVPQAQEQAENSDDSPTAGSDTAMIASYRAEEL